jgi:hypothetical protein
VKIEVGVTHQVRINGTDSWVKLSVERDFTELLKNMTEDECIDYVSELVNRKILDVIEETVDTVNNYTKEK